MTDQATLDSARFIFTTGRMVHERVQRITASACMNTAEAKLKDLSAPQLNMIMMIRVREAVSVTELAALLGVSPPSVSTMVDRLVDRGLLTRRPSARDRRKVVIQISPEAIEEIARVEAMVLASFVDLVEALGAQTTRKWCQVLRRIKTVLDRSDF